MGVGLHLRFSWRDMGESNESLLNVTWHGYMDLACGIVPVKCEAKVLRTFPININLVVLLEYAGKMFNVFFADVLHSKVIDNKGEADWAPVVMPISWCDLAFQYPALWRHLVRRS